VFFIIFVLAWGMGIGWIAQLILGAQQNWGQALFIGVAGSFVGGMIGNLIFGDGFNLRPAGIVGSILGALLLLAIVQAVQRSGAAKAKQAPHKGKSGRHQPRP
jgi:uncharacterized membrane protein YeaQ/YmgE (transglycosylase-associated protein family)